MNDFEEYERQGEPGKKESSELWQVAFGLQAIYDLQPSKYLIDLAEQNIEGKITIGEVHERLRKYYGREAKSKTPL